MAESDAKDAKTAYMAKHAELLESALSDAVNDLADERPDDPLQWLSERLHDTQCIHKGFSVLREFDSGGATNLKRAVQEKHIRFLSAGFVLGHPSDVPLSKRQDLETSSGPSPFLPPERVVQLMTNDIRRLASVSYGWASVDAPDPTAARLRAVQMFLRRNPSLKIEGIFWDFSCLWQTPRTGSQTDDFKKALGVMGTLYASPLATVVLQVPFLPPLPDICRGRVFVFVKDDHLRDEAQLRPVLERHGTVEHFEVAASGRGVVVRYASHDEAKAAVEALRGDVDAAQVVAGATLEFNDRPYGNRGWTNFEDLVTREVMGWITKLPKLEQLLVDKSGGVLTPKLFVVDADGSSEQPSVDDVREFVHAYGRLKAAHFTGKGDAPEVVRLYSVFRRKICKLVEKLGQKLEIGDTDTIDRATKHGKRVMPHGNVYTGDFEEVRMHYEMHGHGTMEYSSGALYKGQYSHGKKDGQGTYHYPNGDVYSGGFVDDKNGGFGTHVSVDLEDELREVYTGGWQPGPAERAKVGRGVQWLRDLGQIRVGEWAKPDGEDSTRVLRGFVVQVNAMDKACEAVDDNQTFAVKDAMKEVTLSADTAVTLRTLIDSMTQKTAARGEHDVERERELLDNFFASLAQDAPHAALFAAGSAGK